MNGYEPEASATIQRLLRRTLVRSVTALGNAWEQLLSSAIFGVQ